ncbi:50S ribosomal protein L24e [Candidatus Woesearchaeota archaeon]|nr:50S ribosomal protein L24e [Candidatus Woesearchaeota archaeon]MCF7901606.1 50S ribosomal protein L24e [Candidatus Woesearchaeota archaeon]MCF8013521.1 50S ribosomal protein L24e [Candidatus Woesearchaeota archaeon]
MVKCDFCGTEITKGTGKLFVKKDGKVINFCSNKCEKNLLKLKRKPRTTTWTNEYQAVKKGTKQ